MNKPSKRRLEWARSVAAVYATHPDVKAIILGGSVGRGTANEGSDIDLGIFWSQVAPEEERLELVRQIDGGHQRTVDNLYRFPDGSLRRQGCIEIIELQPTADRPRIGLDAEHETVGGTELVIIDVIDEFDPALDKQELLSVIESGTVLYGHELAGRWREKMSRYPDEVAVKMVTKYLYGIGKQLQKLADWVQSEDWFCLYEGYLKIGRRLLLALMGLNRVWAFTDNHDFKGMKPFVDGFALQPDQFVDRIGRLMQSEAQAAIPGFVELSVEVFELVETHMSALDLVVAAERSLLSDGKKHLLDTSKYLPQEKAILSVQMDKFMREAMDEAYTAQKEGGYGFGAVLVRDGEIINTARNISHLNDDPTSHSELEVIRTLKIREDMTDMVMYGSGFPCLMCAGAIAFFGIPKIVVGASWPGYEPSLALLESHGVEVELLELKECRELIESML